MIRNGERAMWDLEKASISEVHRGALYESFYKELMEVEALFDMEKLKSLFGDSLSGAGQCTNSLVEEVKRMYDEAKADQTQGEIFVFDAKRLLKIRYQPKFCRSVKVKKRRFRGTAQAAKAHMALHLSEVNYLLVRSADLSDLFSYV